jgi:hypothetical protein
LVTTFANGAEAVGIVTGSTIMGGAGTEVGTCTPFGVMRSKIHTLSLRSCSRLKVVGMEPLNLIDPTQFREPLAAI